MKKDVDMGYIMCLYFFIISILFQPTLQQDNIGSDVDAFVKVGYSGIANVTGYQWKWWR